MALKPHLDDKQNTFSFASRRLQEISDILGVPVDDMKISDNYLLLHASKDGARWYLAFDAQGEAVVRRLLDIKIENNGDDLSIGEFLTRYAGSPQHGALVSLIECLLTTHLRK